METLPTRNLSFSYVIGGFEGETPRVVGFNFQGKEFHILVNPNLMYAIGGCGAQYAEIIMKDYTGETTMAAAMRKMEQTTVYTCIISPSCGGQIRCTSFISSQEQEVKTKMIEALHIIHMPSLLRRNLEVVSAFHRLPFDQQHIWFTGNSVALTWNVKVQKLSEEGSTRIARKRPIFG
ncbi:hypothetical protein C5167_026167 [Papaver somniferum]|nr:hypothetical protein C5167_026167 [Papaver somniferum]